MDFNCGKNGCMPRAISITGLHHDDSNADDGKLRRSHMLVYVRANVHFLPFALPLLLRAILPDEPQRAGADVLKCRRCWSHAPSTLSDSSRPGSRGRGSPVVPLPSRKLRMRSWQHSGCRTSALGRRGWGQGVRFRSK